jgi:hypothetical protein
VCFLNHFTSAIKWGTFFLFPFWSFIMMSWFRNLHTLPGLISPFNHFAITPTWFALWYNVPLTDSLANESQSLKQSILTFGYTTSYIAFKSTDSSSFNAILLIGGYGVLALVSLVTVVSPTVPICVSASNSLKSSLSVESSRLCK